MNDGRQRSNSRRPTYGAATRLARLVYETMKRPHGWSLAAAESELRISSLTLLRYVSACRRELVDELGEPLFRVVRRHGRPALCVSDHTRLPLPTTYQVMFLHLAVRGLSSLDGTAIGESLATLYERLVVALPVNERRWIDGLDRKLFVSRGNRSGYGAHDDVIDVIVQALLRQRRIRIHYDGPRGEEGSHAIDPYTLLLHGDALSLIAYSHRAERILVLPIERLSDVVKLGSTFVCPRDYSPEEVLSASRRD